MYKKFRLILISIICLIIPSRLAVMALRFLGYRVAWDVRIGFSFIFVDRLVLCSGARIGHGNLIFVRRLVLDRDSRIGRGNIIHGPLSVILRRRAEIGNRNKVLRGPMPGVTYGSAFFTLGEGSKITSDHRVDCTLSVCVGSDTVLAGSGSQFWTHGYVHMLHSRGRYRVDGSIAIGNNVYIGSSCIVTTGVEISDDIIVGAGTTISRSLYESGMYVSASIRRLDRPGDPYARSDLLEVDSIGLCEQVFRRSNER